MIIYWLGARGILLLWDERKLESMEEMELMLVA